MCGAILPLCLLQAILLAVGNSQPAVLPDFSAARQRMVQEQLSAPGRDIKNRLVLEAMATGAVFRADDQEARSRRQTLIAG